VRNRQIEARVHMDVQHFISENNQQANICNQDWICMVHRLFYERLPDDLRVVRNDETGEQRRVDAGCYRPVTVRVGRHIPPAPQDLPALMARFFEVYTPSSFSRADRLPAAAAAHHRLAWIHPFLDGNGRVARRFIDGYLAQAGLDGYGLWTISRGFARGQASRLTGLAPRTARQLLSQLVGEGLLVSDTPKGSVRLGFTTASASYWLPDLLPSGSEELVG